MNLFWENKRIYSRFTCILLETDALNTLKVNEFYIGKKINALRPMKEDLVARKCMTVYRDSIG